MSPQYHLDLEKSAELIRRIESLGNIGHWEADLTTGINSWSPQMYRILGRNPETAIPGYALGIDALHPEDLPLATAIFERFKRTGEPFRLETRIIRPNGEIRYLISEGMMERDDNGQPIRVFGISKDITEEKQKDLSLMQSNLTLQNILNTTQDLIFLADDQGNYLNVSKSCEKILGYTADELVGKSFRNLVHPDDFESTVASRKNIMAGHPSSDFQNRYFRKDGSIAYLSWSATLDPVSNSVFAVARDITQLVEATETLKYDRRKLAIVLDSSPEMIWAVDQNYNILTANTQFLRTIEEKLSWPIRLGDNLIYGSPFHSEYMERWKPIYDQALQGKAFSVTKTNTLISPDGHLQVTFNPIFEDGKLIAVGCYAQDIAESIKHQESLQQLNSQLSESNRELEITNRELEQFAHVVSHDLQEPLRTITSFLGLIQQKYHHVLDEKGQRYIHHTIAGAKRMKDILLDLLEFSKIGNYAEPKDLLKTEQILREVLHLNKKAILEKNAIVHLGPLPDILGHDNAIIQLFQNLISNALKYQADGNRPEVWIEGSEGISEWQFSVRDNGIGIDPEFSEKIFVIFQRLHHQENYAGTGIGLAICKKIVEYHGGKIWLESTPGQGSIFYFTLKK